MSKNSFRSGGSSGNSSKRTLNSNNNSSTNTAKKKKTNQKTLGVAWGANPRSSSRSSFGNSPFSDFGSYMAVKNRKLQDQFDAEASNSLISGSDSGKPIFQGVSIFVDGFTVPSSQELRSYMLKHGGRFENYFSRSNVTHIICSNLPESKIKNLRSFSRGLPVVKPTWILDSVAANKLLSWAPYQLDQLANQSCSQQKLSSFFAVQSRSVYRNATNGGSYLEIPEIEESTLVSGVSKDAALTELGLQESMEVVPSSSHEHSSSEVEASGACKIETEHGKITVINNSKLPSVSSPCSDNKDTTHPPKSAHVVSSDACHSTLQDPNFVENYFKSSRLHFIGTWRNRYRKRFPALDKGLKSKSSDVSSSSVQKTTVIHVDMDCFFVSVVIRKHHELRDRPVAVCHSDNARGTAEISSANYPARGYGVKAGIFVRDAKALCPQLVIFPYDFEAYEEVADLFYRVLHKHCNNVQAVSCDEAFLEVTDSVEDDPEVLAATLRREIFETTGCTASAGIGGNMLVARLATRSAKPDGQYYIPIEKVDDYLYELPIKALPGIGHVLEEKVKKLGIQTCGQLRMIPKETLQTNFGARTGDMLWNYSRGLDTRIVGVIQMQHFLTNLCKEVSLRLEGSGLQGRTFTMKLKKRRKDAGEPAKYMGCGDCENLSHSMTVPEATNDVEVLLRISKQLFGVFHMDVNDIRGVGLQVSRLESADTPKQGTGKNLLRSWLNAASASSWEQLNPNLESKTVTKCDETRHIGTSARSCNASNRGNNDSLDSEARRDLPPLCNLDISVIDSLPPELWSEIDEMYGGKLTDFISKSKVGFGSNLNSTRASSCEVKGCTASSYYASMDKVKVEDEIKASSVSVEENQTASASLTGPPTVLIPASHLENSDLFPSSPSQVDTSVLNELPEELRVDILEVLPAHRRTESASHPAFSAINEDPPIPSAVIHDENSSGSKAVVKNENMWTGNPPHWVDQFKVSSHSVLRLFAEMFSQTGRSSHLSAIFQGFISSHRQPMDESLEGRDELLCTLCEFCKQYIDMKIKQDIEEIYVCFRLLKRLLGALGSAQRNAREDSGFKLTGRTTSRTNQTD